jgi:dephospho-CoA kinase
MALKVGITGGIGSGKSVVCEIFKLLGVPVFNSDTEARNLLEEDAGVVEGVKSLFGDQVYTAKGKADRRQIAAVVFADKGKLAALNALVHPAVARRFEDWVSVHASADYVLKEAAILIESGAYKELDAIILVCAPDEVRFSRAAKRDGITEEEVRQRSQNQLSQDELRRYAGYFVQNDGLEMLIPQVVALHSLFKAAVRNAESIRQPHI